MRVFILVLIFFILSALIIASNNELALSKEGNLEKFSELYTKWVNSIYENSKAVTGYVINMDWFPDPEK